MCARSTKQNYIGRRYGRLTVIEDLGCISVGKRRVVKAICDCGVIKDFPMSRLIAGQAESCGCILVELRYGAEYVGKPPLPEEMKICSMCKIPKNKSEYHSLKTKKTGVQGKCIECTATYKKERYWNNREEELIKLAKSRNKPENVLQRKSYYEANKEEYKERYVKYKSDPVKLERKRQRSRKYNKEAYEKIRKRVSEYIRKPEVIERRKAKHHERKKTDIQYVIKRRLRCRLRQIVKALGKGRYKWMSSIELAGCSMEFLKEHIEKQFKDGMCWERLPEIDLDHIKPCARFDLTKLSEQKKCFHFSNIQPLWKLDNQRKNAKYEVQE